MSIYPQPKSAPLAALCGIFGIAAFITPWVLLLASSKLPLRVHDPGYINGFVMGIGFMFFQIWGLGYAAGAVAIYRRRRSTNYPSR
jgi:hypothetical protein